MFKLDVVIGNPPYNDGLDLEFFRAASEISNRYIQFIHPAKWRQVQQDRNALYIQELAIEQRHLHTIHFFEQDSSGATKVWENVQTGSINYWVIDLKKQSEAIDVYFTTNKKHGYTTGQFKHTDNKKQLVMNEYVYSILEKVISHEKFKPIKDRFVDNSIGEVFIANSLMRAFKPDERTDDCRLKGFKLDELDNLQTYMRTPFWRALTRQLKTGFHSYSNEMFSMLPDFDFAAVEPTEEYLEDYFSLSQEEKEYLTNYANDIQALP